MFGSHHDDNDDTKDSKQPDTPDASVPPFASLPSSPVSAGSPSDDTSLPSPPAGFGGNADSDSDLDDLVASDDDVPSSDKPDSSSTTDPNDDELLNIKQDALRKLSPLVGHLEQTPEEKFKTTMMMIQASDDKTKVQEAYEAAQAIEDEKVRAQALLDVVNEINYFTTKKEES